MNISWGFDYFFKTETREMKLCLFAQNFVENDFVLHSDGQGTWDPDPMVPLWVSDPHILMPS